MIINWTYLHRGFHLSIIPPVLTMNKCPLDHFCILCFAPVSLLQLVGFSSMHVASSSFTSFSFLLTNSTLPVYVKEHIMIIRMRKLHVHVLKENHAVVFLTDMAGQLPWEATVEQPRSFDLSSSISLKAFSIEDSCCELIPSTLSPAPRSKCKWLMMMLIFAGTVFLANLYGISMTHQCWHFVDTPFWMPIITVNYINLTLWKAIYSVLMKLPPFCTVVCEVLPGLLSIMGRPQYFKKPRTVVGIPS